jgi:hypothetical protein
MKRYLVRDTCTAAGVHTALDFWLLVDGNNKKTCRFNISTISNFRGANMIKAVIVSIDGQDWFLHPRFPKEQRRFLRFRS